MIVTAGIDKSKQKSEFDSLAEDGSQEQSNPLSSDANARGSSPARNRRSTTPYSHNHAFPANYTVDIKKWFKEASYIWVSNFGKIAILSLLMALFYFPSVFIEDQLSQKELPFSTILPLFAQLPTIFTACLFHLTFLHIRSIDQPEFSDFLYPLKMEFLPKLIGLYGWFILTGYVFVSIPGLFLLSSFFNFMVPLALECSYLSLVESAQILIEQHSKHGKKMFFFHTLTAMIFSIPALLLYAFWYIFTNELHTSLVAVSIFGFGCFWVYSVVASLFVIAQACAYRYVFSLSGVPMPVVREV